MPIHSMADVRSAKATGKVSIFRCSKLFSIDDEIGLINGINRSSDHATDVQRFRAYWRRSLLRKNDTGITRFGKNSLINEQSGYDHRYVSQRRAFNMRRLTCLRPIYQYFGLTLRS